VTNAIHFKAVWQHKFKHQNTNAAPFHTLGGGGELQVQMMRQSSNLAHASFKTHAAVSLPYKDSHLRMLILLPHDNSAEALFNVHASLVGLRGQYEQLSVKPVELALPRFEINAEFELSSVLQSLGVTDPFGMSADFSALTTTDAAGYRTHRALAPAHRHKPLTTYFSSPTQEGAADRPGDPQDLHQSGRRGHRGCCGDGRRGAAQTKGSEIGGAVRGGPAVRVRHLPRPAPLPRLRGPSGASQHSGPINMPGLQR
jgi:hypothetical protein